jgi:hypothetical protein
MLHPGARSSRRESAPNSCRWDLLHLFRLLPDHSGHILSLVNTPRTSRFDRPTPSAFRILWACLSLLASGSLIASSTTEIPHWNLGAVVIVNSEAVDHSDFPNLIEPYLTQFGVPYETRDIARRPLGDDLGQYALIIIGHRALDATRRYLTPACERRLVAAVEQGTGLLSFDGVLASRQQMFYPELTQLFGVRFDAPQRTDRLVISSGADPHYIVGMGKTPRTIPLKRSLPVPGVLAGESAQTLVTAGARAVLVASTRGKGRAALFSTYEWVRPDVKGKVYGLDDLVWRSIVWAARKPFVLRGMPNYLAFRVDDVAGFGVGDNRHLGWVKIANRHGLKPWLGVFIEDLRRDPISTRVLAELTQKELATASVHAYRWPDFFFLDEPLLTDEHGRNIAGRPWSNEQMAANWREAGQFFSDNGIRKSPVILPHFYQFPPNAFDGIKSWGAEFVATVLVPGRGYGTAMLQAGPYLRGEPPRRSSASDPVYIADWLEIPGRPEFDRAFFNFVLEIRDDAGYEWAPSGVPVEEAIRRGVDQSIRAYRSLLPAVLFTHESDYLRHLSPEVWDRILAGVMEGLKPYQPVLVTLDYLCQYLRALHTSRLATARFDPRTGRGTVRFEGNTDLPLKFNLFETHSDVDLIPRELEVQPFTGHAETGWRAR